MVTGICVDVWTENCCIWLLEIPYGLGSSDGYYGEMIEDVERGTGAEGEYSCGALYGIVCPGSGINPCWKTDVPVFGYVGTTFVVIVDVVVEALIRRVSYGLGHKTMPTRTRSLIMVIILLRCCIISNYIIG